MYLAAAAENEAAYSSKNGSLATLAWHAGLTGGAGAGKLDGNGNGQVTGQELALCARDWLANKYPQWPQRVTPQLNAAMPLPLVNSAAAGGLGTGR